MSNSRIIIELAERRLFSVVISFHTLYEVIHNLKRRHNKDIAGHMFSLIYLLPNLDIIPEEEIIAHQKEHRYSIKDKEKNLINFWILFISLSPYQWPPFSLQISVGKLWFIGIISSIIPA